ESFAGKSGDFNPTVITSIVKSALDMFDESNGGFGSAPKFPHAAVVDLLIDQYSRSGDTQIRGVFETTLEKMGHGGVYDQLAGGFHRYSVDERWVVPHFEKMSYDNSELLRNYVHAYQATRNEFFADIARDIIRWMNEWLSDQEQGGFYASQDADISMEDDGDYFTWTLDEARAALSDDELKVAAPYFDINEVGEMHHNPAKNVLYIRASLEEIAARTGFSVEKVKALLQSAKTRMYATRLKRPAPYVDKTVYVNWNALAISAYLQASSVLNLHEARRFALRSLDRVLAGAWTDARLAHVVAYSEPDAEHREVEGLLDDYANTVVACLDAYEVTADLSYFNFATKIANALLDRFFDAVSGGFFDTAAKVEGGLGVLNTRRKPFQDSPTPAGNSVAIIGLLRLHALTNDARYRDAAEKTIEVFAGVAPQYGIFGGTYGLACVLFAQPHTQVVVVGADERAEQLYVAATSDYAPNKSVIRLTQNEAVAQNLPPALAETIPNLPDIRSGKSLAIVCSNSTCQPPFELASDLLANLRQVNK
ncbi:MAG: thioredoxin domain-containing protein, partial [Acidobacteriota bacterium]